MSGLSFSPAIDLGFAPFSPSKIGVPYIVVELTLVLTSVRRSTIFPTAALGVNFDPGRWQHPGSFGGRKQVRRKKGMR